MKNVARNLALLVTILLVAACRREPSASGPLPQDIYVWQQVWTPEVAEALSQARDSMQSFVVFAGQITLTETGPKMARPRIDYQRLREAQRPVGLALRVDPYSGPFRRDDSAIRSIVEFARERLADARHHGVEPIELHFDFDCAESKLEGYRIWLSAVREAVKPLPVYPTALPAWLRHSSFAKLAKESGQFILQVHCVAPPHTVEDTRTLTDSERARNWVTNAGRNGVPFRVALPTYTYLVAFDSEGKPKGVSAEGASSRWQPGTKVVRWEADPNELANLIAEWTRKRPAVLKGLIWYRLPVASDSLNWRWTTLAAVMQGHSPRSDLRLEASSGEPSDIALINHGERDESLPEQVIASWNDATLVSADALEGYELEMKSSSHVVFRRNRDESLSRLSPGSRRLIGWFRCDKSARIRVAVVPGINRTDAGNHSVNRGSEGVRH
jgi:hypothetical protein